MPIYDYLCEDCNVVSEVMVKASETAVTCPECGDNMSRQLSAPMFTLKGVGNYASGCFPKSHEGPHIPEYIKNMPDAQLDKELGLT